MKKKTDDNALQGLKTLLGDLTSKLVTSGLGVWRKISEDPEPCWMD